MFDILYKKSLFFFQKKLNSFLRFSLIHDFWEINWRTHFFMHFIGMDVVWLQKFHYT